MDQTSKNTLRISLQIENREERPIEASARALLRVKDQEEERTSDGLEKTSTVGSLSSRWESITLDTWLYQIIALCFSIACFIALISVLLVYDRKPTPKLSVGLTLNTVISTLATASKSSLIFVVGDCIGQLRWVRLKKTPGPLSHVQLYDNASRGPWGSSIILLHDKGQSLVTVAALITVLALAFDPFVQQILTYPVIETTRSSTFATTKQSRYIVPGDNNMEFLGALNVAYWSNDFALDPTCPSGNCTWPSFLSVELCSKCEDITSSASLMGCDNAGFDPNLKADQSVPCNVSVPQGKWSSVPVSIVPEEGGSFTMSIPENVIWEVDSLQASMDGDFPNKTYMGILNPHLVVAQAALTLPSDHNETMTSHPEKGLKIRNVTQCALSPCARTYSVSVSGGIPSTRRSDPDYGVFWVPPLSSQQSLLNICWKPRSMGSVPNVLTNPPQYESLIWKNATEFAFCPATFLYRYDLQLVGSSNRSFWWIPKSFWMNLSWKDKAPENIQKIIYSGLESVTGNIAASVTKFSRTASNYTITGEMVINSSYVAVHWPWLAFPAALLVMGIVLLASTILVNKRRKLSPWKSSILPFLYHGLENDAISEDDEHTSVSAMERSANAVNVRLDSSDTRNGLALRLNI
jgi:hypothetical protein